MAWLDVVDSAVKIGLGALIGFVGAFTTQRATWREERKRTKEARFRECLTDPIIDFIDQQMAAIGEVYWAHIDDREPRLPEKMAFFQEKHGAMEVRVAALKDPELSELWPPFSRKVLEIRLRIADRNIGDPFEKMQESFEIGGKLLYRLFELSGPGRRDP